MTSTPLPAVAAAGGGADGHTYKLTSDIAQFCLPSASRDANRKFAYGISICFTFLVIGLLGVKTPIFVQKALPEITEIIPIVIIPPPPEDQPPPPDSPQEPDQTQPDVTADTPVIATVVAANPSAVAFAVPVEGPVILAPARFAAPPPAVLKPPRQAPAPAKQAPLRFNAKTVEGNFPKPQYVQGTLRSGETAMMEVLIEVSPDGTVSKVDVQKSTGSFELDRKTVQHIKFRWKFAPGEARVYIYPVEFQVR